MRIEAKTGDKAENAKAEENKENCSEFIHNKSHLKCQNVVTSLPSAAHTDFRCHFYLVYSVCINSRGRRGRRGSSSCMLDFWKL